MIGLLFDEMMACSLQEYFLGALAGRLWQARKSRMLGRNRNRKFASLSEERATNTVWSDSCDDMGAEEEC